MSESTQQEPPAASPPKKKRTWLWIIGGLVLLSVIGGAFSGDEQASQSQSPKPTESSPDMSRLTVESVTKIVNDKLGRVNRDAIERVANVQVGPYQNDAASVVITFAADDNLKSSWVVDGALNDVGKVARELRDRYPTLGRVKMIATMPFKDKYGNVSEEPVVRVAYTAATLKRMQFDNLSGRDFLEVADEEHWVHPSLQAD